MTGATGFIGRRLVARLRSDGAFVRGLARTHAQSDANELVLADLASLLADSPALDGIDVVFHLAAKINEADGAESGDADYQRINVGGTARLVEAMKTRRVRRIVLASSVKAVDEGNTAPVDESAVPAPVTPYGRSKLEAEHAMFRGAASAGFEAVCLRFPLVYGPLQRSNLHRMIAAIRRGRFPPPPQNLNQRSMLHVENAVEALFVAARHHASPGQTYFVTDARPYSTREVYDAVRQALGLHPMGWHVPLWGFRTLAVSGDLARRLTGRRIGFDSDAFQKLLGSAAYSIEKIQRELGYRPSHDLVGSLPSLVREHS